MASAGNNELALFDLQGWLAFRVEGTHAKGSATAALALEESPAGVYLLRIRASGTEGWAEAAKVK